MNSSNNVPGASSAALLKKTPTQVFSCKYCEIVKNTYFGEFLRTAASENTCFFIRHYPELISFFYKNKNEGILLYSPIVQTVFTKLPPFCKRNSKRKIGQVWKGLFFPIPFCIMISNTIVLYTFFIKFFINLKICFE